ncbi:MAG: nucleotidyl transferase AbiEii/AbiGii toxin family protein [Candidatus Thermoplasmatota archaeon]
MLTSGELKRYAHMRRLKRIDSIWKDYLQDLVLHLLYRHTPSLVFRGGTCLWKVYKGDRFSEDLDLRAENIPEGIAEYLAGELEYLGFSVRILKRKLTANMLFLSFGITSRAHPREITISVELLASEGALESVERAIIASPYPDIPPIEVLVPKLEELALDKVSSIYDRDKARDVHDLYILLKRGARPDPKLLRSRVPGFDPGVFRERMEAKRRGWRSLEGLVVTALPPIDKEIGFIIGVLGR